MTAGSADDRSERSFPPVTRSSVVIVAIAVVLVVAAAVPQLVRPGFSPDEEITAMTVSGISDSALPMLPSGRLYLRGLAYSYLAWLTGLVFGQSIATYRLVSLLFATISVVMIFYVAREVIAPPAAAWASLLFAAFPLHVSMAVYARFYTAYMAAMLFATWLFYVSERKRTSHWMFLAACAFCRLAAEFAFLLVLLPLSGFLCAERPEDRRRFLGLVAKAVVALGAVELALATLQHESATPLPPIDPTLLLSGSDVLLWPSAVIIGLAGLPALIAVATILLILTAVLRRLLKLPWPLLLIIAFCGFLFQAGLLLAAMVVACLARPRQGVPIGLASVVIATTSAVVWTLHTAWITDAHLSLRLARQLAAGTLGYPWEASREIYRLLPLVSATAAAGVTAVLYGDSGRTEFRIAMIFGVVCLAALAVIPSEIHARYLFVISATVFIASSELIDRLNRWTGRLRSGAPVCATHAAGVIMIALLVGNTYVAAMEGRRLTLAASSSVFAPPTETRWQPQQFFSTVQSDDLVICNDELACRHLIGRVDYWLLVTTAERERFSSSRSRERYGVYAGAQILSGASELSRIVECAGRSVSLVILNLGKFDFVASRALALETAHRLGGQIASAGGEHLLVRIRQTRGTPC